MRQLIPLLQSPSTPAYPYKGSILEQFVNHAYSVHGHKKKVQTINNEIAENELVDGDTTNRASPDIKASPECDANVNLNPPRNVDVPSNVNLPSSMNILGSIDVPANKNIQLKLLAAETVMRCGSLMTVPASQWKKVGYPEEMFMDLVDVLVIMVGRLKGAARVIKCPEVKYMVQEDE